MLVHTQEAQPEWPLFQCPLTKPAALLQLLFHSKQPPSAGLKHCIPGSSHWLARLDAWRWVKTSLVFCPTDVWLSPPSSSSLCLAPTTCSSIFCPTTSTLICASVLSFAWDPSRYVRAQGGKQKHRLTHLFVPRMSFRLLYNPICILQPICASILRA